MKPIVSKIVFAFIILFCFTLPILRIESPEVETVKDTLEYLTDKLEHDKIGLLEDAGKAIYNQLFEAEDAVPLTRAEKTKEFLLTGYGFGLNSLGCIDRALEDQKFKIYATPVISGVMLAVLLLLQLAFNFVNKNRKGLLSFIGLLILLTSTVIISSLGEYDYHENVWLGSLILISIQGGMIVYFTRFKNNIES